MTAVAELVDVTFRRNGKQIIDGISLTVHEGEHWALLGPNGAGKSTLLGFCAAVSGRTLIARALISEPRLLLLDEPTTGLDVAAREQLLETIDSLDDTHPEVASILVTHHLEELPTTTTHALLIADGRTVASGPAADTVTTDTVTEAFAHPVVVGYDKAAGPRAPKPPASTFSSAGVRRTRPRRARPPPPVHRVLRTGASRRE